MCATTSSEWISSRLALTRSNDDLEAFGAYPHILDIGSATVKDVQVALHNIDAIIWAAATSEEADAELLRKVDYGGVVKVCEAAADAGVKRLLVVSSMDAHPPGKVPSYYNEGSRACSATFWGLMGPYITAKYDAEAAVQKTKLDFTVIRPGALHNDPKGKAEMGVLQMCRPGVAPPKTVPELGKAFAPCARELVAETLMHCLNQPGTAGLTFSVLDGEHDAGKQVELQVAERTDLFKLEA